MFSLCLHGFFAGSSTSSHSPLTCMKGTFDARENEIEKGLSSRGPVMNWKLAGLYLQCGSTTFMTLSLGRRRYEKWMDGSTDGYFLAFEYLHTCRYGGP